MDKSELNYIIDISMAVSFTITAIAGLIIFLFLPSGIKQGGYQHFLGISRQVWINVHNFSGIVLITLILIHLALHRSWIFSITKKIFEKK
jgi:cytochrome b subunit of formate dehydrogenase